MNGRTNSNNSSTMTILGDGIPLDPPSSFLCEARNSKVDITWVDPKDKYATPEGEQMEDTDQLVSVWSYTKIVRKEGSQPTSPSDGVTVCTNTIRNQYQSTIFEDTGVTNGVTYYYAAYAYNTAGTYSDGAFSDGITPIEWDPVLANNSWEQIDSACTQGVAQSMWSVGDEHGLVYNDRAIDAVILDFNHDPLSDVSGNTSITFGTKKLIAASTTISGLSFYAGSYCNISMYDKASDGSYTTKIANIFTNIYDKLGTDLKQIIRKVHKIATCKASVQYNNGGSISGDSKGYNITDDVYIFPPAYVEVGFSEVNRQEFSSEGRRYAYYSTSANLIKSTISGSRQKWLLRSAESGSYGGSTGANRVDLRMHEVDTDGSDYLLTFSNGTFSCYVSFCFCIGQSQS